MNSSTFNKLHGATDLAKIGDGLDKIIGTAAALQKVVDDNEARLARLEAQPRTPVPTVR